LRLVPLTPNAEAVALDMGANFRYGPTTMLIHARANERIKVTQEGKFTRTEFELHGPEQTLLEKGASEKETIIDKLATTDGVYTLVLSSAASMPRIRISNQSAVVKASGPLQNVQPYGNSKFYFFVPKGTRRFAIVSKPQGQLTLEVWCPYDAAKPVVARTEQKSRIFEEHRIDVPSGAADKVWRVQFTGETNMIFLQGIPPLLSSDPRRLLVLP
jgi:hypothetical protein